MKKRIIKVTRKKRLATNARAPRRRKFRLKEKNQRIFINHWIKRNKFVQMMILKAEGQSSLWKGSMSGTAIGFFDDAEKLHEVIKTLRKEKTKYENVFMNIHKPSTEYKPDVSLNKLYRSREVKEHLLTDKAIGYYSKIFIDVDAKCKNKPAPAKITEQCLAVRDKIKTRLMELGFPEPISVATGNGGCLYFSVRGFKNISTTIGSIKNFLESLAREFNTENVNIDTKVYNPARLCRVPDTLNRKGRCRKEQKFRFAKIDSYPAKLIILKFEKFQNIIRNHFNGEKKEELQDNFKNVDLKPSAPILDVEKYLQHYNIEIMDVKIIGGAKIYCLKECVFDRSHSPNDSAIVQQPNGKLSYHCFHDSCKGRTWKDAREQISGRENIAQFRTGVNSVGQGDGRSYENFTTISAVDIMRYAPSAESIIKNFLGKGEATIIAGSGGVGKSFITLYTALFGSSAKKGSSLFGEFEVMKPFSTLIIQAENSIQNIKPRLKLLTMKNPQFEQHVYQLKFVGRDGGCRITGVLSDQHFQVAIINQIRAAKVEVMILDPLISYSQESENDNAGMRKELDGLRDIMDRANVSAFVVHHAGKGHSGKTSSVRGATAIYDWADNVVGLSAKDGDHLTLRCEKSRNSLGFKPVTVNMAGMRFERVVMSGDDKTDTVLSALKALGGKAATQTELSSKIVELTDIGLSTAKREINKAVEAGLIKEVNNGRSKGYKAIEHYEPDELDLNTVD